MNNLSKAAMLTVIALLSAEKLKAEEVTIPTDHGAGGNESTSRHVVQAPAIMNGAEGLDDIAVTRGTLIIEEPGEEEVTHAWQH
ncbi:MAG: hypothetical protein LBC25_01305 [Holosporales bacterium]|nr:hypothetical protein [Holosporales bacterium]